jgi:hypothetical protein
MNLAIDKKTLHSYYVDGDMNKFFKDSEKIVNYLLHQKYKFVDQEELEDVRQVCLMNLYQKHLEGKIKKFDKEGNEANLYSFVWTNSNFRILDHLKKKSNRAKKITWISYDEYQENVIGIEDSQE